MRALLECERPLVGYLFEMAGLTVDLDALQIQPMADGGMGSLAIAPTGRQYGSSPAECHFYGQDGVVVSAEMYLDPAGAPFEVDVWKVDSKSTERWPSRSELIAGPPNNAFKGMRSFAARLN